MTNKNLTIGLVVVAVIAIIGLFTPVGRDIYGAVTGTTNYDNLGLLQLKVGSTCNSSPSYAGCNGTAINRIDTGTCYFQPYATTIAASSTAIVDCQGTAAVGSTTSVLTNGSALLGVTIRDNVNVTLSTTTSGSTYLGLQLVSASASTTQGWISLILANQTGTTFTWPTTGVASGTATYLVTH